MATEESINKHLAQLAASTTRPAGEGSADDKDGPVGEGGDGAEPRDQLEGAVGGNQSTVYNKSLVYSACNVLLAYDALACDWL